MTLFCSDFSILCKNAHVYVIPFDIKLQEENELLFFKDGVGKRETRVGLNELQRTILGLL